MNESSVTEAVGTTGFVGAIGSVRPVQPITSESSVPQPMNSSGQQNPLQQRPSDYRFSIGQWHEIQFYDEQSDTDYPGMMNMQKGYFGLGYSLGSFDISAGMKVNKYLMWNTDKPAAGSGQTWNLTTQIGISGKIYYHLSNNLGLTAFGAYYNRNPYYMMAAYPYVQSSAVGGYLTWHSGRLGLDVGMQRRYDAFRRTWMSEPIVTPEFRVGKNVHIGLPWAVCSATSTTSTTNRLDHQCTVDKLFGMECYVSAIILSVSTLLTAIVLNLFTTFAAYFSDGSRKQRPDITVSHPRSGDVTKQFKPELHV